MIDERRLELFRRIPYVVVFVALVVANLAYVGAGPFVGLRSLRSGLGYAMIADAAALILAFSILLIGRRKRVEKERMAEIRVVFLPEWTYAMLLCILASFVIPLAL
jgi:hypothetical protein